MWYLKKFNMMQVETVFNEDVIGSKETILKHKVLSA